jgi:hypothetical protein
MKNISGNSCRDNKNAFYVQFVLNHAVYEIMWNNMALSDRPQMTIRRMCIACWIYKAKNAHSEYVIIMAFPLEHWLNERV